MGMLVYHAVANFFLNLSAVLCSPLVLSFASAATLGVVETVSGVGMLAGSVVLSAWGGPKQRVRGMVTFIMAASVGLLLMGLRANPYLIAAGFFSLMFNIPLSSGTSQAIFQSKVAPGIQGRVFAMRSMVARSMMPLAFLMAGPLADRIFEPAMHSNGWLAHSPIGNWVGIGAGRGIGVIFVLSGMILLLVSLAAYTYAPLRNVERDLPDVLTEAPPEQTPPGTAGMETAAS